jgi:hypothetical protein
LQTKVGPSADVAAFRKSLATSIDLLAPEPEDYIDLVALHGINRTKELEWIFAPDGCYSVLEVTKSDRTLARSSCENPLLSFLTLVFALLHIVVLAASVAGVAG